MLRRRYRPLLLRVPPSSAFETARYVTEHWHTRGAGEERADQTLQLPPPHLLATRSPFAQLPTELISHVKSLSFPLPGLSTFPERSQILRNFALVSPVWRDAAPAKLFGSPVVVRQRQAEELLRVLDEQPWRAKRVRCLRLEGFHSLGIVDPKRELERDQVVGLFAACTSLRSLWINQLSAVTVKSLRALKGTRLDLLVLK